MTLHDSDDDDDDDGYGLLLQERRGFAEGFEPADEQWMRQLKQRIENPVTRHSTCVRGLSA